VTPRPAARGEEGIVFRRCRDTIDARWRPVTGALALAVASVGAIQGLGGYAGASSAAAAPHDVVGRTSPRTDVPTTLRLTVSGPWPAAVPGAKLTATATVSAPGTVTFTQNGSAIRGCVGVPAPSTTATCTFSAPDAGRLEVVAELAPYAAGLQSSSQGLTLAVVAKRQSRNVGPFAVGSAALATGASATVAAAARAVNTAGYTRVWVVGHGRPGPADAGRSLERARAVARALLKDLASLGDHAARVLVRTGAAGYPSVTVTMGF
jgi:outer membrane protein OmpA-like peptidoglycan-associated protein